MPARKRSCGAVERGFTIIEILVVLLIVMVISGIAVGILQNASKGQSAPVTAATGGAVWRGIMAWRTEEGQGLMPTTNLLLASNGSGGYGGGLVDGSGARTIRTWPESGKGSPVKIYAGTSATVPTTSTAWANGIAYYASADRRSGWMAAYSSSGRLIYQRGIAASVNPVVPIG